MARAPDLPGVAEVTQPHVVGGVEAGIRAEIAVGQGAECLVDGRQPLERGHAPRARCGSLLLGDRRTIAGPIPITRVAGPLRTISLHDTETGLLRRARAPRRRAGCGIYACGPTVYGPIHVGNARPFVVFSLLKRFLATRATRSRSWPTSPTSTTRSTRRGRRAGVPSDELAPGDDRRVHRRHRGLGPRPAGSRAAGERDDRRDHRADRAAGRKRARVRGGRGRLLLGPFLPSNTASCLTVGSRRWTRGRGSRGRSQARPARLRALEGEEARRGHRLGLRPGAGDGPGWHIECSAMAEALLGVGLRDPRGRLRPHLSPPRERGRADRRRRAACRSRGCGCTTGWCGSTSEKMAKSVGQHLRPARGARRATAATR